jgi:agmatine/peptidylarginine deiminase
VCGGGGVAGWRVERQTTHNQRVSGATVTFLQLASRHAAGQGVPYVSADFVLEGGSMCVDGEG